MTDWPLKLGLPLWFWLFILPSLICLATWAFKGASQKLLKPFWSFMNRIYKLGGLISAVFLVLILLIIVSQMLARWTGQALPGSLNFAGYAMACASFFALAYALREGAHIRVSLLLSLNRHTRFWLDATALLIAALIATYFARFAVKANIWSDLLNDRTQGQDMLPEWVLTLVASLGTWPWNWPALWSQTSSQLVYTPLWFPQISMSIGAILLAVALWDSLSRLLVSGQTGLTKETLS